MSSRVRSMSIVAAVAVFAAGSAASGRSVAKKRPVPQAQMRDMDFDHFDHFPQQGSFGFSEPFAMQDAPLGEPQAPAVTTAPSRTGAAIATIRGGMLVADEDSGTLVRTDGNGEVVATLAIGAGAAQVVVDRDADRAYVTDRAGDRVVVVDLTSGLSEVDSFRTRTEPYGLALAEDGATLLVTTVADHTLSAIDPRTGSERWSIEVAPEPRGVALSPDGREALVTFLTTGAIARVALGGADGRPDVSYVALDPAVRQAPIDRFSGMPRALDPTLTDEGKSFARNAFAAAYVGHGVAVVPHQLSTPHLASDEFQAESSGYGGGNGFTAPVSHRLAFLDTPDAGEDSAVGIAMATTNLHQPRALAYDGAKDILYVAGFGTDNVMAIGAVSQASVHGGWQYTISSPDGACGPSGLAVDPADGNVVVWCSLSRQVVRLAPNAINEAPTVVAQTAAITQSRLSADAQRGRELFRSGLNPAVSTFGAMACSSCHAEARADGLSWRLQGKNLQTPLLAGRIVDAHPFKWDGKDPDITASLTNTVTRLGGTGIDLRQAKELAAFLESVEAPRKPAVDDASSVARGEALFHSDATGCASCHNGALMTDQQQYDLASDLDTVDTPSLVGLAISAPYYHDGSAATLEALLRDNASVHGMGSVAKLSDTEIGDLVQYLRTL